MERLSVSFKNPAEKAPNEMSPDERESLVVEILKHQLDASRAKIKVFSEEIDEKLEVIQIQNLSLKLRKAEGIVQALRTSAKNFKESNIDKELLQNSVIRFLAKEKEYRVTQAVHLEEKVDRSLFELKCEISREKKNGMRSNEKDVATFAQLIIDIGESVKKESRIRLERQQDISKALNEELARFYEIITHQRLIRQATHTNFKQMIDGMKFLLREKLSDLRNEHEVWLHNFKSLLEEIEKKMECVALSSLDQYIHN